MSSIRVFTRFRAWFLLPIAVTLCMSTASCTLTPAAPPTSGARLEYAVSLEFVLNHDPGEVDALAATAAIVEKRIARIARADITTEAPNRMIIDLPNVPADQIAAVKDFLSRAGMITFAIVDTEATEEQIAEVRAADGETADHRWAVQRESGEEVLLLREGELRNVVLDTARRIQDSTGAPALSFSLGSHAELFGEFTGQNVGRQLAIALNEEVVQSARINQRIDSNGIIEGNFTPAEIDAIITAFETPFGVPPTLVSEIAYGPEAPTSPSD